MAVAGVIAKVAVDVLRDLREDREAHGGLQTTGAAKRALAVLAVVLALVLLFIVLPLILGGSGEGVDAR